MLEGRVGGREGGLLYDGELVVDDEVKQGWSAFDRDRVKIEIDPARPEVLQHAGIAVRPRGGTHLGRRPRRPIPQHEARRVAAERGRRLEVERVSKPGDPKPRPEVCLFFKKRKSGPQSGRNTRWQAPIRTHAVR